MSGAQEHGAWGGRLFCNAVCRDLYDSIHNKYLSANPRFAPPPVKQFILERDRFTCAYCGKAVTYSTSNVDHMTPWPRGKTRLENLVTACRWCNRLKYRRRMRGKKFANISKKIKRGVRLTRKERSLVHREILVRNETAPHPSVGHRQKLR
jgi:hypothetical protein